MRDRISIEICNKDRATELAILLHSLRKQTFQDFDIIVLDDSSGTPPMQIKFVQDIVQRLKLEGHGVKFLRNNISYGVCKARNRLLDEDPWKECTNFVCRLDDDVILEPDYLKRLIEVMSMNSDCGIASGVTPLFCGPDFKRETKFVSPIVNKIELDNDGNIVKYADDCGFSYMDNGVNVLVAHQFRSNAVIRREIINKGLRYELGLTNVGFREEAFFSLRALMMGYKIVVDLQAVAWHSPCASGGCRYPNYSQMVQLDDDVMRRWVKNNYLEIKKALNI